MDELSASDIQTYNEMLNVLSHRELICGFLLGKDEFYHDTKLIKGDIYELLKLIEDSAVNRAIKIGACNIYHGCVHNMLHEKDEEILRDLYKSASFVTQAICFKQTGNYVVCQKDLLDFVSEEEQISVQTFLHLKNGRIVDVIKKFLTAFSGGKKLKPKAAKELKQYLDKYKI